jgi:hypothetical protein
MALALLLAVGIGNAQDDDRAAILTVMQRAFDAVQSADPEEWRAIQLDEGTSLSFRPHPDGETGEPQMRLTRNEAFVEGLKPDGREFFERWTSEPVVMIRGPIAIVWGEYDFWVDGKIVHCGVDAVDLVKIEGTWMIANFMWTVERGNCPAELEGEEYPNE